MGNRKGFATALDKQVGTNIKMIRFEKGLSQTQLGQKLGITFQQVQKYESGRNRISASNLYRLSKAFEVPMEEFFHAE